MASVSRIDQFIGFFCKRALIKRRYSAKDTYNLIDRTNRSQLIMTLSNEGVSTAIQVHAFQHTRTVPVPRGKLHNNKTRRTVTLYVSSHHTLHGNTLRHTATHCNTPRLTATHCDTLQHTAIHYDTRQHTATHCNTLQHTATHCNTLQHTIWHHTIRSMASHQYMAGTYLLKSTQCIASFCDVAK